ncbi:MAG: hypothetical protein IJI57_06480 [Flexilinea sp.]|nr:hypothetical protein [Flexilinea sp.]
MASGTITHNVSFLHKGVNNTGRIILPGYNTGSRNYFAFFIPCNTEDIASASAVIEGNNTNRISIYVADASLYYSENNITPTSLTISKYGLFLEIQYPTTRIAEKPGVLSAINIIITCS